MMGNTVTRIWLAAGLLLAVYFGSHLVRVSTRPPEVKFPDWSLEQLPMRLGAWEGENVPLDRRVFIATGAKACVNRVYVNQTQRISVTLHTAVFEDPAIGVYHTPAACYRAAGWRLINESSLRLPVNGPRDPLVRLGTWERDGERVQVLYWYEWGEYTLYDRLDLGGLRWKMRGRPFWPPLLKVMFQVPAGDKDASAKAIQNLAELVFRWIRQVDSADSKASKS